MDFKRFTTAVLSLTAALILSYTPLKAQSYTMEAVTDYPFPRELTSCAKGSKIAMTIEEQGRRNVYVAEGPLFKLRKLTNYQRDDGQEITSVSISDDGKWVVYVRGGEHSGNRDRSRVVNPIADPLMPKIQVCTIPFAGGAAKIISEGDYPAVSPKSDRVAFIKDDQIWLAPVNGSKPAENVVNVTGECSSLQWSPDGGRLAFVCNRTDHAFVGIYQNAKTPVTWISPSFSRDASPRWSPDSKQVAFIRTPGSDQNAGFRNVAATGGQRTASAPATTTASEGSGRMQGQPWAIWVANSITGEGKLFWKAPATPRGSLPTTDGGANLNWAGNYITFLSYQDGWPHLYSMPAMGGEPVLLTPGDYMAEEIKLSSDAKWLYFAANTGPDKQLDIDRRHIVRVAVDKPDIEVLTPGTNLETYPAITGDGAAVAMFTAGPQRPVLPAVMLLKNKSILPIGDKLLSPGFPVNDMIIPKQVVYTSPDGTQVHAQLFEPKGVSGKIPAIVYVHGGPQRQMLLGWHHMDYYSIDYALNQYLVSKGFAVLAVNYRQGIGYGYDFHRPAKPGANYIDVKAGGDWLHAQPWVDTARIGIYGGSAGGALTATALARDSRLFKAGVIIHGNTSESIDQWTSPTLIIHGDDDRNVAFSSGVSLVRRFEIKGSPYFEFLAIPDDSHHWMKYSNVLKVNKAAADFLMRQLKQ